VGLRPDAYHLDRKYLKHHDAFMRTTVTLDPDVEHLLRLATRGSQQSFKAALNDGLRRGLAHLAPSVAVAPFVVKARPMGLRTGVDSSRLHDLADDLEAEAFAVTPGKLRKALRK
jgi:hypothetical protein